MSRRGRGAYGVVYRAVRDGQEQDGLVALKIAVMERDPRYEREVELLSRVHHPSVPRTRDPGDWRSPGGRHYPYLVMDWVEGVSLYAWAATDNPSSRQVLRLLAQVARALEATQVAGGVHLDVKGDNVLVQQGGERASLTDFGAGHSMGAETLTPWPLPPGTPAYRSPEAWQFALRYGRHPRVHYAAGPADDLFALGVTAYRLVTDKYPPSAEPGADGAEVWHAEEGEGPLPPIELNPRVAPRLNALILRMLSVKPEARGTARELAEALEQAAETESPEAHVPLFGGEALERSDRPTQDQDVDEPSHPERGASRKRWVWLTLSALSMGLPLVMGAPRLESGHWESADAPLMAQADDGDAGSWDGGSVRVGDSALASTATQTTPLPYRSVYGLNMPKEPLQGQRRPPCPRGEVELRGGCWVRTPDCPEYAREWKGDCYVPAYPTQRPTTSEP